MADDELISYAQNGEDVVLWRALSHISRGVYVDVGGWDPDEDSITRLFYDRGWRGVDIEPVPEFAERFRERRPLDDVVQAAVTDGSSANVTLHRFGASGLSTVDDAIASRHQADGLIQDDVVVPARTLSDVLSSSALIDTEIHFLKVDVEGAEERVLRSLDLGRWRPWVMVVEATEPNSAMSTHHAWEPALLEAGYIFTLFDGLSRFYVAAEHSDLVGRASYPACALDRFRPAHVVDLDRTVEDLRRDRAIAQEDADLARAEVLRWRGEAVNYWANAMAKVQAAQDTVVETQRENDRLRAQMMRVRQNLQIVKTERKQLRARVKRMSARIERISTRAARTQRPQHERPSFSLRRLGAAARRIGHR